jgi:5-methylcytosine-specific restriction endonuclease McrA
LRPSLEKKCRKCKKKLPLKDYSKDKTKKDNLAPDCRSCRKENRKKNYNKQAVAVTREKSKIKNLIRVRCNQARHNWKKRAPNLSIPDLDALEQHIRNLLPLNCFYTGKEITEKSFGIDHKIPIKKGGNNELQNLVLTTQEINKAKGDMTDSEFVSLLKLIEKWEDKGESLLRKLRAANTVFKR